MTQSNLLPISDTASIPAPTQRPALVVRPADTLFDPARGRDEAAVADASPYLRDLELAYGCVDWFIYVTDSVAIGPMTRLAGNE